LEKVGSPFSLIALTLIACSFIFGPLRQQSMGFRLVIALFVGLSISIYRTFRLCQFGVFAISSMVYFYSNSVHVWGGQLFVISRVNVQMTTRSSESIMLNE
jgi:lipopolysaccharide export system permease protein